ncbi:MAG: ASCH domain-containing protein [Bacilli bacterium]
MTYHMYISDDSFIKIINGTKKMELRLNNEDRSLIDQGDEIIFTDSKTGEIVKVFVVGTKIFRSYKELSHMIKEYKYDFEDKATRNSFCKTMKHFFYKNKDTSFGVIGINIKIC